jgi:phosphoglycolate phosphatase-like HAD superfamily hydrolase
MENLSIELHSISFFDGVFEMVKYLKDRGIKTGIVTSETKEEFAVVNSVINIRNHFEPIICMEDVINPKPSGEPLLLALENMGIQREEGVYVGDSINDLMCAREAGVDFYLSAWGMHNVETAKLCEKNRVLMHPFDLINVICR